MHPCLRCGACCAYFRVGFYWREAEAADHQPCVPAGTWVDLNPSRRAMKGTEVKHNPKCDQLAGKIGKDAHCTIYESRPSPCRAFEASYENGSHNERCDQARAHHGLPALRREDWSVRPEDSAPLSVHDL